MIDYREFSDRIEFVMDGVRYVEEDLCVKCPECGEPTSRIVTSYNETAYVHVIEKNNHESYCMINRGMEVIPDPMLFTIYEGARVISLVEALW
jgi:hypothetical protein